MILSEELGARVLRDLAELVVDVGDDAALIGRRDDGGLIEGVADLVEAFQRVGHRPRWPYRHVSPASGPSVFNAPPSSLRFVAVDADAGVSDDCAGGQHDRPD